MSPRQTTREHALAQWVLDVLPGEGRVTHMRQSTARGPVDQVWTSEKLQIIAKRVCEGCNTVWMSKMEGQAKPILSPMILGERRTLSKPEQAVVAAWSVKTALALHLTTPEDCAPPNHYRHMARTKRAPHDTRVWLASYRGWRASYHHSSQLRLTSDRLSGDGYSTTLSIGSFVVQVLGYSGIDERLTISRGGWRMAAPTIHPFERAVVWPPSLLLDDAALLAFAARFETPP